MPRGKVINMDAVRFGTILTRLRLERGWTRAKLATRSGLSANYIGIIERGGNVPTLSTALELAEVLGADIAPIMAQLAAARVRRPAPATAPVDTAQ